MGRLSILPEALSQVETIVSWVFFSLALIVICPWLLVLVYDMLLYMWRALTYDIPVVGGRARGRLLPRAPSLSRRGDGHRRHASLVSMVREPPSPTTTEEEQDHAETNERNDSVIGSGSEADYKIGDGTTMRRPHGTVLNEE